ncbi:MAG: hypothetical protein ACR2KV_17825 [Solirubrobacteraceae bacterium]
MARHVGNRALARAIIAAGAARASRPPVQRRQATVPRTKLVGLDDAFDERTESTRRLLGLSVEEISSGTAGLPVPPTTRLRLEHARNFLEAGASVDEARFVFRARMVEADLDQLVGVMLGHLGHLDAVRWALGRSGIGGLAACMANAEGLDYDTVLTAAYYDAGVLPARSIAQIMRSVGLGAARTNPARVASILRFLDTGATEAEARFALGAAAVDGDLDQLVGVMLGHLGHLDAVRWALGRSGIGGLEACMVNAEGLDYDTNLTTAYYDAGVLPRRSVVQIMRAVGLGAGRTNPTRVDSILNFLDAGASENEARFALHAAPIEADLALLVGVMIGHLGHLEAVEWALARGRIAGLAECIANAGGLGYDTALTTAYYDAGVLPGRSIGEIMRAVGLGAPRTGPSRVGAILKFLEAGASEAEARFALQAAPTEKDLPQLVGVMLGHLGQPEAIKWAVARAAGDWGRAAADLEDARNVGYDTDLAEWARKTAGVEAERTRLEQADRIDENLNEREKALGRVVTEAEKALVKIKQSWAKKHWFYHPAKPSTGPDDPGSPATGTAKRVPKPGTNQVEARTAAETAVSQAEGAVELARAEAEDELEKAEAGKARTEQAFVDLVAAYVRAGVATTDAQLLYAQLGWPHFRALYDTFGAGTGALVNGLGARFVVHYLKARSVGKIAPLVSHLTPGGLATLTADVGVDDTLALWDVFGPQCAPLIAASSPRWLSGLVFDHRGPLVHLFTAAGGTATTLLSTIGQPSFEWLLRELKAADLAAFLASGVSAPRLAEIGRPSCVKTFALGCTYDRASLISLCNSPATTSQIISLINLCTGTLTLARCVTALPLARNPASLVTILGLQGRAGLADSKVDTMLGTHAGLPAPARDIEHDVYQELARRAQNEVHLDGPGLHLLMSAGNVHYPVTITWIEDKQTSYDTGNGYSEMYSVLIAYPGTNRVWWQIHLHRKGGTTTSGSIKKLSQRYATGAGVYRGILPKDLEDEVRKKR